MRLRGRGANNRPLAVNLLWRDRRAGHAPDFDAYVDEQLAARDDALNTQPDRVALFIGGHPHNRLGLVQMRPPFDLVLVAERPDLPSMAPDGFGVLIRPAAGAPNKPASVLFGRHAHKGLPVPIDGMQGVALARRACVSRGRPCQRRPQRRECLAWLHREVPQVMPSAGTLHRSRPPPPGNHRTACRL